jgi:hypothetical protein
MDLSVQAAEERSAGAFAVRICIVALGKIARPAVGAGAASNRRADHDAVARAEIADQRAHFLHDPHAFMAQDRARLHSRE